MDSPRPPLPPLLPPLLPPPRRPPLPRSADRPGRPARATRVTGAVITGALLLTGATVTALPASATATAGAEAAPGCVVVGSSRAGRAWLPRARVLVEGTAAVAVRTSTPHTRVAAVAGLVEVQRTSRDDVDPAVLLEVTVGSADDPYPRTVVCQVEVGPVDAGPTAVTAGPDGPGHGARRLVRAD